MSFLIYFYLTIISVQRAQSPEAERPGKGTEVPRKLSKQVPRQWRRKCLCAVGSVWWPSTLHQMVQVTGFLYYHAVLEVDLFDQRRCRPVWDGAIQVLDWRGETPRLPGHHQVWEGGRRKLQMCPHQQIRKPRTQVQTVCIKWVRTVYISILIVYLPSVNLRVIPEERATTERGQ